MLTQGFKNIVCVYIKMCQISKKAYKKCKIEISDDREYFWIKRRGLEIVRLSKFGSDFWQMWSKKTKT